MARPQSKTLREMKGGESLKVKDSNKSKRKEVEMRKTEIDGLGVIVVIVGLSLFSFGQDKSTYNAGLITIIIGLIRIFYVMRRIR